MQSDSKFTDKKLVQDIDKAQRYFMERSCGKCIHFKVCSILEHMQGLSEKYKVEQPDKSPFSKSIPFHLEDMAKICGFYSSQPEELE